MDFWFWLNWTDWNDSLSERLASLGIIWDQLKAPLRPLNMIVLWCTGRFQGPVFSGILTKPKACIAHSKAILTLVGTFLTLVGTYLNMGRILFYFSTSNNSPSKKGELLLVQKLSSAVRETGVSRHHEEPLMVP